METSIPQAPVYSAPQGGGGMLNQPLANYLTLKNVLIFGGLALATWYFLKQSKEKAYDKALLEMSKNPIKPLNSISKEDLTKIRYKIEKYVVSVDKNIDDRDIEDLVIDLTTV